MATAATADEEAPSLLRHRTGREPGSEEEEKSARRDQACEPMSQAEAADEQKLKKSSTTSTTSGLSLENVCWLVAAVLTVYLTDIFRVLLYDERTNSKFLKIALALIGLNICIAGYVIVWLAHVRKLDFKLINERYYYLIASSTAAFVVGSIALAIAIWPVYSWLSGPILFVIFMGFIVVIINLPSWM